MNYLKSILILFLFLFSCKGKNSTTLPEKKTVSPTKEADIFVLHNEDGTISIDVFNWVDSLPDSIYTKKIKSAAFMENSHVKLRESFLTEVEWLTISTSSFRSDTLIIDKSFENLSYLSLIQPSCIVKNVDTLTSIRKLDYFASKEDKYNLMLDFNKINGLDSLTILAPNEVIELPLNKEYKRIYICTKNKQVEQLRKYYKNTYGWSDCGYK